MADASDEQGGVVAGVDIGNSTTEVSIARIGDDGQAAHLGTALTPTTGVKGTPKNADGVVRAVSDAMRGLRLPLTELRSVFINEATPVISGLAMETVTETIITESTMIGHDPRTPGGLGLGVGLTVPLADLDGVEPDTDVVVVVEAAYDFADVATRINASLERGVNVKAAILANDDAVLVRNRVSTEIPVVDEVGRIDAVPLQMLAAVEVAAPGHVIRTLSNAYGVATVFGLDADQTRAVAPVARALTGNRSAVVVRTPSGDVTDRVVEAGKLTLIGQGRSQSIDVSKGAEAIMAASARVVPLQDATGEPGTNVGGMLAGVRDGMAELLGLDLAEVKIRDILAVDTFVPQEVRGGLASEMTLENAVALAAMVRTRRSGMAAVADAVSAAIRGAGATEASVHVGGVEAEMAVRGALTTPGTDTPLVVLDLGGGSTDAAAIERNGDIRSTHVAGAGDLVSKLIGSELGIDNLEVAEQIKQSPLARVESFFHARLENGTVQFSKEPHPPSTFARVVTLGEGGSMAPVPTRHSLDRVRQVRRAAKERVFVVNALRALTEIAPHGDLRQVGFVVLLGGSALDFEIPELIADALAPYGVVCGAGNVRATEGPRNAVATGLVLAHVESRARDSAGAGASDG